MGSTKLSGCDANQNECRSGIRGGNHAVQSTIIIVTLSLECFEESLSTCLGHSWLSPPCYIFCPNMICHEAPP